MTVPSRVNPRKVEFAHLQGGTAGRHRSIRHEFADMLGKAWGIHPDLRQVIVRAAEGPLGETDRPVALIRMRGVASAPSAPLSHRNVLILLTIVSPDLDADAAMEELDSLAEHALDFLDTRFVHEGATFVGYDDRLAVDIPITILAQKGTPR